MAALGSDNTWRDLVTKDINTDGPTSKVVLNAAVVYRGAFCTHNTAFGFIKPYDGTVTDRAVGWHFGDVATGNSAEPRVNARIISGGFQVLKAVAGLNGTTPETDYGVKVYISNDNDLTLTGTTLTMHVGFVGTNSDGVTLGTDAWVEMRHMAGKIGGE
jgi:hypothetical protein